MSGYSSTGSLVMQIAPASISTSEQTNARRGRSMKILENMSRAPYSATGSTGTFGMTLCVPRTMTSSPSSRPERIVW